MSPSGKLPVTFYESLTDLPDFEDYSMARRTYRYMEVPAQYPFGFGLTYSDVVVSKAELVEKGGALTARVTVENRGGRDTGDVVQVYVRCEDSAFSPRNPSLCAFQRVFLRAGETRTLQILIPQAALTVVNDEGERVTDGKTFTFHIGTSQPDEKSRELTGREPVRIGYSL